MKNNYINEITKRRLISLMLASSLTLTSFGLTGCGKKKSETNDIQQIEQSRYAGNDVYKKIQDSIDEHYYYGDKTWFCDVWVEDAKTTTVLGGAKFELRDENNNLIDSWISSSKEAHRIENLEEGVYTLTEVVAPDGYVVAGNKNTWTIDTSVRSFLRKPITNVKANEYVDNGVNNILNTGTKEDIDGQYFVLKLRESYENKLNNGDYLAYGEEVIKEEEIPKYILMKGSKSEIIGSFTSDIYAVQYEFFGTEENLSSLTDSATNISLCYYKDGVYTTRIWKSNSNITGILTNASLYIVPLSDLTKEELEELSLYTDINTVEKAKTRTLTR